MYSQSKAQEINALLLQSISDNDYSVWDKKDLQDIRGAIQG